MDQKEKISDLISFIQENIRASDTTKIVYIDTWNLMLRLHSDQNIVVFGRRGVGKTILLNTLKEKKGNYLLVKIDVEQFKTKSFPNIILSILEALFSKIKHSEKIRVPKHKLFKRYKEKKIRDRVLLRYKCFRETIKETDEFEGSKKTVNNAQIDGTFNFPIKTMEMIVTGKKSLEKETMRGVKFNKTTLISNEFQFIKRLIQDVIDFYEIDGIDLCLDDLQYLEKNQQAKVVDFFHRMSKDTKMYLKVATIKNQSVLLKKINDVIYGVEIGDDAQEINLDISLEDFSDIEIFFRKLYKGILQAKNIDDYTFKFLDENAWIQLCIASGGVPRDFLQILKRALNMIIEENSNKITQEVIIYCSRKHINSKKKHINDEFIDNEFALEASLIYLTDLILDVKKTNVFLISNIEIEKHANIKKSIIELLGYKMIHLVQSNIDIEKVKNRYNKYSCYLIDVGLYRENHIPSDFNQIKPEKLGETRSRYNFRSSVLSSSPIIDLEEFDDYLLKTKVPPPSKGD